MAVKESDMMPNAEISDLTSSRLQSIAVPLVDTYDSVIAKLLDHWDLTKREQPKVLRQNEPIMVLSDGTMEFSPANPPQLNFTTCHQIEVNGAILPKSETYWNNFMTAIIREVHKRGHNAKAIYDMLQIANAEIGEKVDNGYKYLASIGLSVQGQDSNAAFRQAYQLAVLNGIKFKIFFSWQNNEKALYANQRGYMEL
jgi:hypothetical protein